MPVLDQIPNTDQFATALARIIGSEGDGTGLAGALKLLSDGDAPGCASSVAASLGQGLTDGGSAGGPAQAGAVLGQFNQILQSLPEGPQQLIQPLLDRLGSLQDLSVNDLPNLLGSAAGGLGGVQSSGPGEARDLVSAATTGFNQLKDNLLAGPFGELKDWSDNISGLGQELAPIIAGDPGTVQDRLVAYVVDKLTGLMQSLLPQQQSLDQVISAQLDLALSPERVALVGSIKGNLVTLMGQVRDQFEGGDFVDTALLTQCQDAMQQLGDEMSGISSRLGGALNQGISNAEGLAQALTRQIEDFASVEIVDLGILRETFANAIGEVQEVVEGLNLEVVQETINEAFDQVNQVITQFDLGQVTDRLNELLQQIESGLDYLDAALLEAVAFIRDIFSQIRTALRSMAEALGSYDAEGQFHFQLLQDLTDFLNGLRTGFQDTVQPALDDLNTTVDQTLRQVRDGLNAAQAEIESVRNELVALLQGFSDELNNLDVAAKLEELRLKLDDMINQLTDVDFDLVVDPVVEQLGEMRDQLAQIDVSSLNEILAGTLKVSLEVVVGINFTGQITGPLMEGIDQLLETPKSALAQVEAKVEEGLARFGEIDPDFILDPLVSLFDQLTQGLDQINVEQLLQPLDEWHATAKEHLESVSPAALLQPVVDLYDQFADAIDALSPEELIRPLQDAVDGLKASLAELDITGISSTVSGAIDQVKAMIDSLSPVGLLDPLVAVFDEISGALDQFNPSDLLQPINDTFDQLLAPLDNITAQHTATVAAALAPLAAIAESYDPQRIFTAVSAKYADLRGLLQQVNVGVTLVDLNGPYGSLNLSFEAGGVPADDPVALLVESLNPVRNSVLGQAATAFQQLEAQLQSGFSSNGATSELTARFEEIRPKLESLAPAWASGAASPELFRGLFQQINPLNITAELDQLYDAVKQQFRNLDPRIIQQNVQQTFDLVKAAVDTLDPAALVSGVQGIIDSLNQRLDAFNLQFVVDELDSVADEVKNIIGGLDPRPIIQELDALVGEVSDAFDSLKPSEVLSGLSATVQEVKDTVELFNPEIFREPLRALFDAIARVLSEIDVGVILQPLTDRLESLRDELEEALKKAEDAFNEMLRAIPL